MTSISAAKSRISPSEEIPFPNKPDGIINTETFENVGVNSLNEPIYKITHSVEIDYQES